jgi:hypothetical protein
LHELEEIICNEMYTIPESINDEEGDLVETVIKDMSPKFALVNTPPDFGPFDFGDPFAALGPIAVCYNHNFIRLF